MPHCLIHWIKHLNRLTVHKYIFIYKVNRVTIDFILTKSRTRQWTLQHKTVYSACGAACKTGQWRTVARLFTDRPWERCSDFKERKKKANQQDYVDAITTSKPHGSLKTSRKMSLWAYQGNCANSSLMESCGYLSRETLDEGKQNELKCIRFSDFY